MSKVGILGGTFDPIHTGHVMLAETAAKELKLAETLIIPAAEPPHKEGCTAPFTDRFAMAERAFAGRTGFTVSDIENKLGGRSFTINTVRALKEIYPKKTEFYLIIGGDQLFTIEKWFRYEALLKECHITAVTRGDISYTDMQEYANELGRVKVINAVIPDISSAEIREKLKNGEDIKGLVPDAVREYIEAGGLYRG